MTAARRTTRVRGLAPWKPQDRTEPWVAAIKAVLEEDRAYWPLTTRNVWYRLIGRRFCEKDTNVPGREGKKSRTLQKVEEVLNRARRAQLIPWEALTDDGVAEAWAPGFTDVSSFWEWVGGQAKGYARDLLQGQPVYVEVWTEAAGMVPRVAMTAHDFGVSVFSGGGFDSLSWKKATADRLTAQAVPVVVLHIGDMDRRGGWIFRAIADDVGALCRDLGGRTPEIRRLAVIPEQVAAFGLETDERGNVQAEAVPAAVLSDLLTDALDGLLDADVRKRIRQLGDRERQQLLDRLGDSGPGSD